MVATYLKQLIEPFAELLTVDSARKIASLQADELLQKRVDELADMANRGTLTADDREEYDRYLAAFYFVTIMQSRARRFLRT